MPECQGPVLLTTLRASGGRRTSPKGMHAGNVIGIGVFGRNGGEQVWKEIRGPEWIARQGVAVFGTQAFAFVYLISRGIHVGF